MNAGRWPSPLDAATVAAAGVRLAQPMRHAGATYWLEGRPSEGGRVTLCRAVDAATSTIEELAPAPLSVRTRVHEYGGGAYLACDIGVLFVAEGVLADGRGANEGALWWRDPGGALTLVAAVPGLRFADLAWDARRRRVLCVGEDLRADPHRPRNLIAAIALPRGEVTELIDGRDFYAAPRLAPDGATLAYLAWDLPDMPWDGAVLHLTALDADGRAGPTTVRGGPAAFQPEYSADGTLWWSEDGSGRFTLNRVAADADRGPQQTRPFPDGERECALPLWNLNMRGFAPTADGRVAAASVADGLWSLRMLDPATGSWRELAPDLTQLEQVHADGVAIVALGGGARSPLAVERIGLADGARTTLARANRLALPAAAQSVPEPVRFAGDGGEVAALWWPPASADHALARGERPPLLLRCHGGPTAAASSAQDARTLYWTSRGFAVLDLNYRGSWGFGRAYRRALEGRWGELDARDAVAAARWAIASGRVDPARIAITGSSAGGLTALNALAEPDAPFRSAAIHYGLAELVSAMTDTHKFEAGYGERLLGPWPAARAVYERRSPLTRLTTTQADAPLHWPPTLLLQGADDKVVRPDQSARLAEALRARGIAVELVVYPGEGHGFRRAATIVDALERELAFHLAAHDRAGARRA